MNPVNRLKITTCCLSNNKKFFANKSGQKGLKSKRRIRRATFDKQKKTRPALKFVNRESLLGKTRKSSVSETKFFQIYLYQSFINFSEMIKKM